MTEVKVVSEYLQMFFNFFVIIFNVQVLSIFLDSLLLILSTQTHSPCAPHPSFMPCLCSHIPTLPSHMGVYTHVSAHTHTNTQQESLVC